MFTVDAISSGEANNYMFKSPRSDPSIRATSAPLTTGVRDSADSDFHQVSFVSSAPIKSTNKDFANK
jgi:hypothetical protein